MLLEPVSIAVDRPGQEEFQYPLSGRCYWSFAADNQAALPVVFQYPLSGRCYWSPEVEVALQEHLRRFSTLFRVDAIGADPNPLAR